MTYKKLIKSLRNDKQAIANIWLVLGFLSPVPAIIGYYYWDELADTVGISLLGYDISNLTLVMIAIGVIAVFAIWPRGD